MSLASNIQSVVTRMATESKALRTLINGNAADLTSLTTTAKTTLVAAINEVNSKPPATTTLAALTDTTITTPATGQVIRYDATTSKWVNVNPLTYFQAQNANLTTLAGQTQTAYGQNFLTLANQAALLGLLPSESETAVGVSRFATQTETNAGTLDTVGITPLKFQTRLAAFAQPLATNLTTLAGQTQTSYGQNFLTLANQAALMALLAAASDTVVGVSRQATPAEVTAGTLDSATVTPLKLQNKLGGYQPLATNLTTLAAQTQTAYGQNFLTLANQAALFALLPTDTDGLLAANSDAKIATQKAVKTYADALINANDAMQYKGVIDASLNPNYPAASAGWFYKISVAGKIGGASGINVEVGDSILCTLDGSAAGTQAGVGANWNILQANIDGAVIGPASSTSGDFAFFSGTAGKLLQDTGISLDNSATMTTALATKIPTTQGVAGYTYSQTQIGDPTTDFVATFNAGLV